MLAPTRTRLLGAALLSAGLVTTGVPLASAADTALVEKSLKKTATASSSDAADRGPSKGNDGATSTRWASEWRDGQWWQIDLGSRQAVSQVKVTWEYAYASRYRIQTSLDGSSWTTAAEQTASGAGEKTTTFSAVDARYVRIAAVTRGTRYGISFYEAKVLGPSGTVGPTPTTPTTPTSTTPTTPSEPSSAALVEKARGKTSISSSSDSADRSAPKANDGSTSTRWASAWQDGQWWQVDLGSKQDVRQVKTSWEYAYASRFRVQTSADGTSWSTAAEDGATGAGDRTTTFTPRDARFVRITGLTRGTQYGISLFEVKVLGVIGTAGTAPGTDEPAVEDPKPAAPAQPTAPTTPTTPPASGGVRAFIEFAAGNPFTTPLPTSVPLLPAAEQDARRKEVRAWMSASATGIEQRNWSSPLYVVYRNGEIRDSEGDLLCKGPLVKPSGGIAKINAGIDGKGWPTAACLDPEDGEGHLAMWNPETGAYVDFYGAKVGSSISYAYGGAIPNTRAIKLMNEYGGGPSTQWQGGVAAGVPLWGTYVTEKEIRDAVRAYQAGDFANAYIPHVLGYEAYRHTPNTWEYPASKTDFMGNGSGQVPRYGVGGDPNYGGHGRGIIPMGGIWRLDPSIDVFEVVRGDGTAHGDMLARIFARTLQKHGATMTDFTGGGFVFLAEQATHQTMFDYKNGGGNNAAWVKGLLTQSIDNKWMQFVNVGRNVEVDEGEPAQAGTYRPPSS